MVKMYMYRKKGAYKENGVEAGLYWRKQTFLSQPWLHNPRFLSLSLSLRNHDTSHLVVVGFSSGGLRNPFGRN